MREKRIALSGIIIWFFMLNPSFASPLSGSVQEDSFAQSKMSKVIDGSTGLPVGDAKISIPAKGISVTSDSSGYFHLDAAISEPAILSVQKKGYKPFSITISDNSLSKPFVLSIDKQAANQLVVDSELRHLGDDNYSSYSANASDFKTKSNGPSFSKDFFIKGIKMRQRAFVSIGSIIGLDTETARRLGQNKIKFAHSSPTEILVNGEKVGEIKINGDNQRIEIPSELIKPNSHNKITIKTGYNLTQLNYTDYDDMEMMNVVLEVD